MKLELVTKLDIRNMATSKKFDHELMSENCDVIVISQMYGQFDAIWKPNFRRMVCITFYLTQTENRTKKSLTQLSYYCLE